MSHNGPAEPSGPTTLKNACNEGSLGGSQLPDAEKGLSARSGQVQDAMELGVAAPGHRLVVDSGIEATEDASSRRKCSSELSERAGSAIKNVAAARLKQLSEAACSGVATSSGLSSAATMHGSVSPKDLLDKCQWIIDNKLSGDRLRKMDDDFWNDRSELMNTYASILNADLQFALHSRVVHKMWKHGVKAVIDQYHRLLSSNNESDTTSRMGTMFQNKLGLTADRQGSDFSHQTDKHRIVKANYTHFLEETRGFYLRLLMTITLRSGRVCGLTDGLQISGHLVLDSLVSSPLKRLFCQGPTEPVQQKAGTAKQQRALQAIIHSLLVQMGDLARYLHHFADAERCYEQAARVAPSLGQPYNQLAILFEGMKTKESRSHHECGLTEGERILNVTFYYVRALAVPVSFTLAAQNLKRITRGHGFLQFAGRTESALNAGDGSTVCTSANELLNLFLYVFAQMYDAMASTERDERPCRQMPNQRGEPGAPLECKLAAAIHKFRASIVPVLTQYSLSSQCLVQIAALSIFLHYNSVKGSSRQSESLNADQCCKVSPFAVALLTATLDQLIEVAAMPFSSELTLNRSHVLPAAYILLLYVLNIEVPKDGSAESCEQKSNDPARPPGQSVEMSPVFWLNLGRLLSSFNIVDKELAKGSFLERHTGYYLTEERYLQCFLPLDGMFGSSAAKNRHASRGSSPRGGEEDATIFFHNDSLCEKDELQLRKIRMVSMLQEYLACGRPPLDGAEMCPVKCLRNTVPLKIALLPIVSKPLPADDSENCDKKTPVASPRHLCFQSDLSLLQRMQSMQEARQESTTVSSRHEARRRQGGRSHAQQPRKAKHINNDGSGADVATAYGIPINAPAGCEQVTHGAAHAQFMQQPARASFAPSFANANPVAMATMLTAMRHFLQCKQPGQQTPNEATGNSGNVLCQPVWYQLSGRPSSMMPMESRCTSANPPASSNPMLAPFHFPQPVPMTPYEQWPSGGHKGPSLPGALAQKFNDLSVTGLSCHPAQTRGHVHAPGPEAVADTLSEEQRGLSGEVDMVFSQPVERRDGGPSTAEIADQSDKQSNGT